MSETEQATDAGEPAAATEQVSGIAAVFGPTLNAVFAPDKAFAALDSRPRLAWWVIVWVTVGLIGLSLVNLDLQRQFMRVGMISSMQQRGQSLEPEQLARMVEGMDRFAPLIAVGQNLVLAVLIVVVGVVFWGGSTVLGGKADFARSIAVAAVGGVVQPLLTTAYVGVNWWMNPPEVRRLADIASSVPTLSLDLLVGSDQMSFALRAFLMRVDLFNLWWIVLVTLGAERLLGVKRAGAVGLAVGIWLASSTLAAFMASFSG